MISRHPFKPAPGRATAGYRTMMAEALRHAMRCHVGRGPIGMVRAVWSWTHGLGLVAAGRIPRGCIVVTGKVIESGPEADPAWTFTLRPGCHAWLSPAASILNHSCAPNLGIIDLGGEGYGFRALYDIAAGEEMTRDYGCTEGWNTGISQCHCGSSLCTGTVPGYFESAPLRQAQLRALGVAQWIMDLEGAAANARRRGPPRRRRTLATAA